MIKEYDVVIIGAGPAGLTSAIYCARYGLDVCVVGKVIGGLAVMAHKVCNYPGYDEVTGGELVRKMKEQVKKLGVEIFNDGVNRVKKTVKGFLVSTEENGEIRANKIIIATGTERRKLGVAGEEKYIGRGLSYCAVCDAAFYKGKDVVVVGGNNAALTSALLLSDFAKKVYVVYRGDRLRGDFAWIRLLKQKRNVENALREDVKSLIGDKEITGVVLLSGKKLDVDGVFVEIGGVADARLAKELGVKLDKRGYIITDDEQKTNIPGVYAAGDVTNKELKQIITACGEGAVAAYSAYDKIKKESLNGKN